MCNMCERIYKDGDGKHYDVITIASAVVVVVCKNNEVLFCSPLLGRVCFFLRYLCACVCLFRLTDYRVLMFSPLHSLSLSLSLCSPRFQLFRRSQTGTMLDVPAPCLGRRLSVVGAQWIRTTKTER